MLADHAGAAAPPVDYARDVLPVLQRSCFECHGPEQQKGKLRLDSRDAAFKKAGIIVKGSAAKSELVRRITLPKGHDDAMPNHGEPLSRADTDRIRAWIDAGANWPDGVQAAKHWAYVKPVRPALPSVQSSKFKVQSSKLSDPNPIDALILARLAKEGLQPSPEASPEVLIRRLSLDLIGLPPTPAEVETLVREYQSAIGNRQSAIGHAVDRLLASPQFGEKWARHWLDLARYADSNGFQRDGFRDVWAWRDWVIRAMNADMPFDRFTVWQLAGDLLAPADLPPGTPPTEPLVATGFHRCTTVNVEAGTDQEENRVNQVVDRVNTTGTVWLGSTLECAQCHNHKYDAFTQRDYYRLFAFFNNTEIETKFRTANATAAIDFTGPAMELHDPGYELRREQLQSEVERLADAVAKRKAALAALAGPALAQAKHASEAAWHLLDIGEFHSSGGATSKVLADKSALVGGIAPAKDTYTVTVATKLTGITAFKLETLTDPSLPGEGPGRGDKERPNFVLNTFRVAEAPETDPNSGREVNFASASADFSQANLNVSGAIDRDPKTGWAINPQFHKPHWAVFVCEQPAGVEGGTVFTFTLEQNYGGARTIGRLRLSAQVGGAAAGAPAVADAELKKLQDEHDKALAALKKLEPPQTLVMKELAGPRETAMFKRGNFLDRGERVQPGVPEFLHPLRSGAGVSPASSQRGREARPAGGTHAPLNRLDLARWLTSRENPLVARATVNRWWAELFGQGLVTTPEDFGVKGERPSHPELLDWLAVEFMDRGWSMKHILKAIVTSATYRQSSRLTPALLARDDRNVLLARGARFRLDAEAIRDNALAVSGLLSLKQGGPPVRPFQPAGVWTVTGLVDNNYRLSEGEDAHRRGIYTVWRRSALYPSFVNFDATPRGQCTVKRSRSNTPLQALTLLNDPVYVEAAAALALRVLREKRDSTNDERLAHAFRLCLARAPTAGELAALHRLLESELAAKRPEAAAWQSVATALLNLDETITKG
jgi:hypothetical protein